MSDADIVRGWKDGTAGDRAREAHPSGDIDVMRHLHGGVKAVTNGILTAGCCNSKDSAWSCYFVC